MINIRKANPEDVLSALELARKIFTEFEPPYYSEEAIRKFIGGCVENEQYINNYISQKHLMFIAVDEDETADHNKIVGVISERGEGRISMLFVDGAYQRQGIATALMDTVIAVLAKKGVRCVTLEASPAGMPFYLKYGFTASGEEQNIDGFVFTPMYFETILFSGYEKLRVKRKTIKQTNWKCVTKSASAYLPLDYQGLKGMAGLFEIREVTTPLIVTLFGKRTVMADRGFHRMQIGPENKNWWLTVLFDAEDKPVEYYFDITKDNTICGEESFYLDLFIDVVLLPDGRILTIDADELEQAFAVGLIGQDDYRLAVKTAEKITAALPRERFRLTEFCDRMFAELKKDLRED